MATQTHQFKTRISFSFCAFLLAMNCLIIGNLIGKTEVMFLGIICLPASIILLNPLAQTAVIWLEEANEE